MCGHEQKDEKHRFLSEVIDSNDLEGNQIEKELTWHTERTANLHRRGIHELPLIHPGRQDKIELVFYGGLSEQLAVREGCFWL